MSPWLQTLICFRSIGAQVPGDWLANQQQTSTGHQEGVLARAIEQPHITPNSKKDGLLASQLAPDRDKSKRQCICVLGNNKITLD